MQNTLSHNPLRVFRAAILNGVPVPATVRAALEANGVNTAALEAKMRDFLFHREAA